MHKLIKYITALLLLLIFPLSAFSFNIKISRCNHSGKVSIIINNTSGSACKCCSNLKNVDAFHKNSPSLKEKQCAHCCKELNSNSDCCNQSTTRLDKENKDQQNFHFENNDCAENNNVHDAPGIQIESKCCSSSIVSANLNAMFSNLELAKKSLNPSIQYRQLPNLASFLLLTQKNTAIESIVHYPLKGPVCGIISYIHFSFLSGNDIDPNSNRALLI